MTVVPDAVVTLEEQARQHRARAAAFTEARDLLLGLEDTDAGDIIAVADWLITGDIDAMLRRDDALHARYARRQAAEQVSVDAASWSPSDLDPYGTGDGSYPEPTPPTT